MKSFLSTLGVLIGFAICGSAGAVIILTLDNDGTPSFQQTQNNPCVIGNPSCNQPAGFGFNDINPDDNDTVVTFAESNSTYTVAQVEAAVGGSTAFSIGIDTNQAGIKFPQDSIFLTSFQILINGVLQYEYNGGAGGTAINIINGNGYSDALLSGIDLSIFPTLLATDLITFQVSYFNATNGPESFFLVRADSTPCIPSSTVSCGPQQIPEPGTLALLGIALLGGSAAIRRRSQRNGKAA